MQIIVKRKWGEPKLKKPKFLNNKTLLGSITFSSYKPVKCKVWKVDNEYYILHRDWFSQVLDWDKAIKLGIIEKWNQKFIYNDNFAGAVLRNECIFKITEEDWYKGDAVLARDNLCVNFGKMIEEVYPNSPYNKYDFCKYEWSYLFEQFVDLAKIGHFNTYTNDNHRLLKPLK